MVFPDGTFESEPASDAVPWVRKRDGSMAAFDPGKLASTILAAQERVGAEDPVFLAQELTHAVMHFLADEFADRFPTTEEISETVTKVLREMGHADAAMVYHNHGARRQTLREQMRLVGVGTESDEAGIGSNAAATGWNKRRIALLLESEADLDSDSAREVATSVERKLLASGLSVLTTNLVDELILCELMERGIEKRWSRRLPLGVSAEAIQGWVDGLGDASEVVRKIGGVVLERFALREVFSRDVRGLLDEGVLTCLGGSSPIHGSIGVARIRRTNDGTTSLSDLDRQCREASDHCEHALILDGVETLVESESFDERPMAKARVIGRIVDLMERALERGPRRLLMPIRAPGLGRAIDETNRPLFGGTDSVESHDRNQSEFGVALIERAIERRIGLDQLRFDLYVPIDEKGLRAYLSPFLPFIRKGAQFSIVVDRGDGAVAEGVGAERGPFGALQYIGINLDAVLQRHGTEDEDSFFRRLSLVVDSAVRAGVQKRESLRRSFRSDIQGSVVLVPLGIDSVVERLTGKSVLEGDATAVAFAEQLLDRVLRRARRESKHYQLRFAIDGVPCCQSLIDLRDEFRVMDSSVRGRLVGIGRLHRSAEGGSTLVRLHENWKEKDLVELALNAARQTDVRRIVVSRPRPARQATLFE